MSDFAAQGVPGLSGFTVDVASVFAATIVGYSLGDQLGDPEQGESTDLSTGPDGFVFNVEQQSHHPASYLTTQLPDSIVLATFQLMASEEPFGPCFCIVIGAVHHLFDGSGTLFIPDVVNEGVLVTVVPLPASLGLFLCGLAVFPSALRKPRTHRVR
ncbi:MAG: hypothetical protein AAFU65_03040 [Pseudomonadota bacterium]